MDCRVERGSPANGWPSRRRTQQKSWARRGSFARWGTIGEGGGIGGEVEIEFDLAGATSHRGAIKPVPVPERALDNVAGNRERLHASGEVAELEINHADAG